MAKGQKTSVEIDELSMKRVLSALDEVPDKARKKLVSKGLRKAAKIVRDRLKAIVPTGETKGLKKAVKARSRKKSRTKVGMIVMVEAHYAANLNYGTKYIEPMDFLGEAARAKRAEAIDALVETLKELAKELTSK